MPQILFAYYIVLFQELRQADTDRYYESCTVEKHSSAESDSTVESDSSEFKDELGVKAKGSSRSKICMLASVIQSLAWPITPM